MRSSAIVLLLTQGALSQINLGTFSLRPEGNGGWNMGIDQGVNIFGFGGDRALKLQGAPGQFGISGTGGALIGNERVGQTSGLSVGEGRGLDLGSQIQLGNNPAPSHPGGQLGSLVDGIGRFFQSLIPRPPGQTIPGQLPLPTPSQPHIGTEGGRGWRAPSPWERTTDSSSGASFAGGPRDGDAVKKSESTSFGEEFNKDDDFEGTMKGEREQIATHSSTPFPTLAPSPPSSSSTDSVPDRVTFAASEDETPETETLPRRSKFHMRELPGLIEFSN